MHTRTPVTVPAPLGLGMACTVIACAVLGEAQVCGLCRDGVRKLLLSILLELDGGMLRQLAPDRNTVM